MGYAPENTLPSFAKAAELGVQAVECDVHLTRDCEVVVIHDDRVERTSDGEGAVADMTLVELKRLDFGSRFAPCYAGTRIPTLSEALQSARELGLDIIVEIKGEPEPARELVARAVALIGDEGMRQRAAIISFHHPCLLWAREADPAIATGILYSRGTADPLGEARAFSATSIRPHHSRVSAELARQVHDAGLCLHTWTVDDEGLVLSLIGAGVDSIACNFPDRAISLLRRLGRLA
jgi:glycerophosphoryl diester phosphodiesterase